MTAWLSLVTHGMDIVLTRMMTLAPTTSASTSAESQAVGRFFAL